MQGLDAIGEQMHAFLREKNAARDKALEQSRTLIRYASLAIRAVHREERDAAAENIRLARAQAAELEKGLAKYPDLNFAGYTQDALKELAEASIVFALIGDLPLPDAGELGVEAAAYLNGLGEAAGELRRWSLDLLRRGKTAEAERVLAMMDDIYSLLVTLDFPDALTGGLRRTTDMVRGVTERTRGDLTLSLRMEAAERAAAALEQSLGTRK
ncbi:MAG: haloacid dehalogenase [Anaerolineales bacterium]|nr:haloacid dehalogenase [Anaerolineales bacterium]